MSTFQLLILVASLPLVLLALSLGLYKARLLKLDLVEKKQKILTESIQNSVNHLMAKAVKMKQESADKKLTQAQRDGLEEAAITMAIEATETMIGGPLTNTYQDLQTRVTTSVRMAKMQWCGSGMTELPTLSEIMNMKPDDDDDEEFKP